MVKLACLVLTCCLGSTILGTNITRPHLIEINMIFRHGARTPLNRTYPTNPYNVKTYLPYQPGQLTKQGLIDGYKLGKQLRSRYGKLLGEEYNSKDFTLYSDEYERVQETALAAMAALWEPKPEKQFIPGLGWTPVPYQYKQYYADDEVMPREKLYEYVNSPEFYNDYLQEYNETIAIVKREAKANLINFMTVDSVIEAQTTLGLEKPVWYKDNVPKELSLISNFLMAGTVYTNEQRREGCLLVKEWLENSKKAKIYASHDNNIAIMMRCLKVWFPRAPKYASNLVLEVYQLSNSKQAVRVVYQHDIEEEPEVLVFNGCGRECLLEQFCEMFLEHTGIEIDMTKRKQ